MIAISLCSCIRDIQPLTLSPTRLIDKLTGEFGITVQLLSETQSRLADMKRRMKTLRLRCDGLNLSLAPQVGSCVHIRDYVCDSDSDSDAIPYISYSYHHYPDPFPPRRLMVQDLSTQP